jgi:nickel-dependent lactate racemase
MVGEYVMKNYNIFNHYCRDEDDVRRVAEIDGAPIEVNRRYLDADLKILTGLIEPHMYAGYSGGRKAILPGISSYRTMQFMHSFRMIDHPQVTNAALDGNPFHEAGQKVLGAVGCDFLVNVVINKQRQLVGVYAGDATAAHREGCETVRDHAIHDLEGPADLVVTSGGGYPLDATFYQVSKGLIAARNMVKPGGTIVIACECREGFGSKEYSALCQKGGGAAEFFERYSKLENFVIDQWCLQTTYQALQHAGKIYVYSPYLDRQALRAMGFEPIDDVQSTLDALLPDANSVVAVPEGPYVVGVVNAA